MKKKQHIAKELNIKQNTEHITNTKTTNFKQQ